MYQITINEQTHHVPAVVWVKQLRVLGKVAGNPIGTLEDEAEGIYFDGRFCTLLDGGGKPLMEGEFDAAVVERVEAEEVAEQEQALEPSGFAPLGEGADRLGEIEQALADIAARVGSLEDEVSEVMNEVKLERR
jgi:hypothetical protein